MLGSSPDGIGETTAYSSAPGTGLEWIPKFVPRGTGDDAAITSNTGITSTNLAVLMLRGLINAGAGAVVGVALAPSHDKRVKYGVIGSLLGAFLGPLGIGAQALYVISKD